MLAAPLRCGSVRLWHPASRACATVLLLLDCLLCRLTAGHTEAQAVVAERRDAAVVAERRPAAVRVDPPAAAAKHAGGAPSGANRIGAAAQLFTVAIRTPLLHVAVHIMQAPQVWLLQANRVGVTFTNITSVVAVPRVLAKLFFIIAK